MMDVEGEMLGQRKEKSEMMKEMSYEEACEDSEDR